jgi:hypothetical protein
MAWGPGTGKSGSLSRLGDALLVASPEDVGSLRGVVSAKSDEAPYGGVRLEAVLAGRVAGGAQTDAEGRYEMRLLPGAYELRPAQDQGVAPFALAGIQVVAGRATVADLQVAAQPYFARLSVHTSEAMPGSLVARLDSLLTAAELRFTDEPARADRISRRIVLASRDALLALRQAVDGRASWKRLSADLQAAGAHHSLRLVSGPIGSGQIAPAGPGERRVSSYGRGVGEEALADIEVRAIRAIGDTVWMATEGLGIFRVDDDG